MKVEQMALKNENNFKRLKTCSHVEFNSEFNGIFFFWKFFIKKKVMKIKQEFDFFHKAYIMLNDREES